ncbi:MAG TPA: PQQ-binding-like beta-propeller repeat protein, partial [Myxococcaceae bacterium]|nr:PQQ-binding-like beta-propeller repeat protein [Myxococcaceae bacterium]
MSPPLCQRLVLPLLLAALMGACQEPADKLWAFSTDAPARAALVPVEEGVLAANEAGRVFRLARTGEPVWRVELGREVAARPAVSGDSILVGTVGGVLVSLALSDGSERWRLTGQPSVLTPLVSDEASVYVVGPDGTVRAHALETGEVRWRRPPPGGPRPDSVRSHPAPLLAGGLLLVALDEVGVLALSPKDGRVRWQQAEERVLGMTVHGDTLYASTATGQVMALGLADGQLRWRRTEALALTSPPTFAQEHLWVGAEPDSLLVLSPEDGRQLSRLPLPAPVVAQAAGFQDWLLVPTRGSQGWLL